MDLVGGEGAPLPPRAPHNGGNKALGCSGRGLSPAATVAPFVDRCTCPPCTHVQVLHAAEGAASAAQEEVAAAAAESRAQETRAVELELRLERAAEQHTGRLEVCAP
jgi:hypothetical protein